MGRSRVGKRTRMDTQMECRLKIVSRGLFMLLLLPALIWGYGKSVFQLAQVSDDSNVDGSLNAGSQTKGSNNSQHGSSVGLKVSAPVQSKIPSNSEIVTEAKASSGANSSAESEEPGTERAGTEAITEPDLSQGTYNQVRAKKPSIPSRFGGSADVRSNESDQNGNPISLLGLLGIPTLIFSVMFFAMWGIISGKIQRIMV